MALEKFNLPPARLVGGNPLVAGQKSDYHTKKLVLDEKGQPITQYRCELAIEKNVFMQQVWPYLAQEAARVYPNAPNVHPNNYLNEKFAWKVIDGDSTQCPQGSKVPYNARDGYPGHYIIKLRTEAFAPRVWKRQGGNFYEVQANELKTGDYLVAQVNVVAHAQKDGGLYFNPNLFEFIGVGEAIVGSGGGNPDEAFGQQNYQLPAGARPIGATPLQPPMPAAAPGMMTAPALPAQPMQPAMVAPAPQQGSYAPSPSSPMQPNLPPPAHDFVQNAGLQPGMAPAQGLYQPHQGAMAAPAMPVQPGFTPAAPAQPVMQPGMTPAGAYGAAPVNMSPSNPGMPQMPMMPQR